MTTHPFNKGMSRPATLIIAVAVLATLGILSKIYLLQPDVEILTSTQSVQGADSSQSNVAAVSAALSSGHKAVPAPTTAVASGDLSVGSSGNDVTALQQFLEWKNILAPNSVSGYFGNVTQNAVRTYQLVKGLPADGVVNAATRAAWAKDIQSAK